MVSSLPALTSHFTGPGRAYACKDKVGLVSRGSRRLGVDVKKMCATFVVTTDDPDRVDDVVVSAGIDLTIHHGEGDESHG